MIFFHPHVLPTLDFPPWNDFDFLEPPGIKESHYKLQHIPAANYLKVPSLLVNPFNPKFIMQILPAIQEENDWVV